MAIVESKEWECLCLMVDATMRFGVEVYPLVGWSSLDWSKSLSTILFIEPCDKSIKMFATMYYLLRKYLCYSYSTVFKYGGGRCISLSNGWESTMVSNDLVCPSVVLVVVSGCLFVCHTHDTPLYSCILLTSNKSLTKSKLDWALYPMKWV